MKGSLRNEIHNTKVSRLRSRVQARDRTHMLVSISDAGRGETCADRGESLAGLRRSLGLGSTGWLVYDIFSFAMTGVVCAQQVIAGAEPLAHEIKVSNIAIIPLRCRANLHMAA